MQKENLGEKLWEDGLDEWVGQDGWEGYKGCYEMVGRG